LLKKIFDLHLHKGKLNFCYRAGGMADLTIFNKGLVLLANE